MLLDGTEIDFGLYDTKSYQKLFVKKTQRRKTVRTIGIL